MHTEKCAGVAPSMEPAGKVEQKIEEQKTRVRQVKKGLHRAGVPGVLESVFVYGGEVRVAS